MPIRALPPTPLLRRFPTSGYVRYAVSAKRISSRLRSSLLKKHTFRVVFFKKATFFCKKVSIFDG